MTTDLKEPRTEELDAFLRLDCQTAQSFLEATNLDLKWEEMKKGPQSAIRHYFECKECYSLGLQEIVGTALSHQESCEIWAEKRGDLCKEYGEDFNTLREVLASEHVWGRDLRELEGDKTSRYYPTSTGACNERVCSSLRQYWQKCHCSHDKLDETDYKGDQLPFLIRQFLNAGWKLDKVFALQLIEADKDPERHMRLLQDLVKERLVPQP
ncbi:MAG: hypothetical protein K0S20_85 [Patescibacteria group bacterium]|jgi:hypothetical protein|nr:hypothetical protein [Patescibacteria group bacterium]